MSSRLALQKSRNPHLMLFFVKMTFLPEFRNGRRQLPVWWFRIRSDPFASASIRCRRTNPFGSVQIRSGSALQFSGPDGSSPCPGSVFSWKWDPEWGSFKTRWVFLFTYSLSWFVNACTCRAQSDINLLGEILVVDKDDVTLMLQISHPVLLSRTRPGI